MKLKLPSFEQLFRQAIVTLKNFPMPILVAIIGTITGILLIENKGTETDDLFKILMTCGLGLPLLLGVKLWLKSNDKNLVFSVIFNGIAVGLLVLYYFSLPERIYETQYIQYFVLSLSLHFWVSFAPYLNNAGLNGYWQFNKTLFIRILTVFLFSIVIYLGLAAALAVSDELFGLNIRGETYGKLWMFIIGIFNTWMFLGGVPLDFQKLEEDQSYPKGLKMFTQFVLLPLVLIYLAILYLYLFKIIVSWSLPKGLVSWLVNIFSVLGILAFLLIYPLRLNKENKWISLFSKWFFIALYPLIGLLLVAILTRVFAYGITENRYFVLLIAAWLAMIAFYYLIKGFHNIKIIPISLFVFGIIAAIGPFSALNVSIKNQSSRLHDKLEELNMIQDGFIIKQDSMYMNTKTEQVEDIHSIVYYLAQKNALNPFAKMLKDTIVGQTTTKYRSYYTDADRFLMAIGINKHDNDEYFKTLHFSLKEKETFKTKGAAYFQHINLYDVETNLPSLIIYKEDVPTTLNIDYHLFHRNVLKKLQPYFLMNYDYSISIEKEDDLFFEFSDNEEIIGFQVSSIDFNLTFNDTSISNINGYLLFK